MFYWIVDLMIPVIMITFGAIFIKYPPKKINCWYGYRTIMSRKTKETWDFAHHLCGIIWFYNGIIFLGIIIISKLFIPIQDEILSLIHLGLGLVGLISVILIVEIQLRRRFNKDGIKK